MNKAIRRTLVISLMLALALAATAVFAQQHESSAPASQVEATHGQPAQPPQTAEHGPNATPEREIVGASERAEEPEENSQFKQSPMVKKFGRAAGLDPAAAYWVFLVLNFAVLAGFFYWLLVKKLDLGNAMRNRTATIQKGMADARHASEEANARLAAVQARLNRLDAEVVSLRSSAEADFAAEEARIRQSAEEDACRVVEAAEQEIASAAKNARRELKTFAASLAVDLAEKKIKIDGATDQQLVRDFVDQLAPGPGGKDGK